jgi:peptidoglycan/LPS O-acetylase OafA/YrhL
LAIPAESAGPERNAWLDICRALAILLVLLSHSRFFLHSQFPWADGLRFGGFLGVELFFVLSGFLIGGILIRLSRQPESQPWRNGFYARRWLRTLPNYYLFLSINVVLAWTLVRPGDMTTVWQYLLFLQNLAYPAPSFFAESWSLAVEEVFYLIFPILILILSRAFRRDTAGAVVMGALIVIVGSFLARLTVAETALSWDEDVRKVVAFRLDSLMFGVMLAWLYDRKHRLLEYRWLQWMLIALFLACAAYAMMRTESELDTSWFAKTVYLTLTPIGCAGLISIGISWKMPVIATSVGRFLARISYSAYLANIPVAMILLALTRQHEASSVAAILLWFAFMGGTVTAAWSIYRGIERPIFNIRDRYFPVRGAVAP